MSGPSAVPALFAVLRRAKIAVVAARPSISRDRAALPAGMYRALPRPRRPQASTAPASDTAVTTSR